MKESRRTGDEDSRREPGEHGQGKPDGRRVSECQQ